MKNQSPRIAVSACLLGEEVRYDGSGKLDPYLVHTLGRWLSFIPVCPECEAGLSVPREPVNLWDDPSAPRAIGLETGIDYSHGWRDFALKRLNELAAEEPWGMVLKSRSPSCGIRVDVHTGCGARKRAGMGIFAAAAKERLPLIPVESEAGLYNPSRRENFIVRLFAFKRLRDLLEDEPTRSNLTLFHNRERLLMMAHSPELARSAGRVVADPTIRDVKLRFSRYSELYLKCLGMRATRAKNLRAIASGAAQLREGLRGGERAELAGAMERYRLGELPRLAVLTLLYHWARREKHHELLSQSYLCPHPVESRLLSLG
ncbi:MAG: DUF1722 domain-containing protein [Deltaproteobacteria bacterium]|nr:MAG: DUF1722 domain-containing protein [Deltaproteobacteria bacterium]